MRNQKLLYLVRDVQRHLDGTLTLASIARHAGKSRFQVHREYSRVLGETPRKYIERLRLEEAAARLIGSSKSVFEIALGAGFSSHEVFTRAFRRKFGCTPVRYRTTASPHTSEAVRAKHLMFTTGIGPCVRLFHLPLHTGIGPCVRLFHLPLHSSTRKTPMPTISVTRQQLPGQAILLIAGAFRARNFKNALRVFRQALRPWRQVGSAHSGLAGGPVPIGGPGIVDSGSSDAARGSLTGSR